MKTQIAAIEFGTSKIVTVIAQSGGMDRLDIIGSGTVPYDGYSNGDWNTPGQMIQRVRDSIAAAELEANSKIREIYVGVPGEYVHVCSCETEVELPDGVVDETAINAVQDAAADKLRIGDMGGLVMHRTPSWFIVDDGKKTMTPGGRGTRLRAMTTFIIADPQFIDDVSEMIGRQSITILGFLSCSLGESLLVLSLEERDRVAVLIDVGYLNTEISVVEGDAIIYHAMLPRGGGYITADLATKLRIPMRSAEQIKRGYVFSPDEFDANSFSEVFDERGRRMTFPREQVSKIVEESFSELAEMIDMTLRNDVEPLLGKRSQVFLTGGGIALMRGAREALAARIDRPVKVSAAKSSKLNSPVFSASLGLADLVFDSIENQGGQDERLSSRLKNIFGGRG
ncbi:MAG: rod shape-determining protein [Clostridia bacterium]|nr:rod shape-determining protein [Clostridia bacterium]